MLTSPEELPSVLQEQWMLRRNYFAGRATTGQQEWLASLLDGGTLARQLPLVWACSEYVAAACAGQPTLFQQLVESGDLEASYSDTALKEHFALWLSDVTSEDRLLKVLRQFRTREMVRIIWRDLTRSAELEETTADMSRLAEACLQGALDFLYPRACAEWGTPVDASGEPQQLVILGMGKLGACELNVSSDIDLIFAYPEAGETRGGRRSLSNQEFFIRLGQWLIKALDTPTVDGFVFRVDMRLRPYGQSGALVLNFDAMEEYYQTQGRDWERYAMIKARVVAGDRAAGSRLMAMLRPFTYRKYLDFSAFESLRGMKAMINREVQRKGLVSDVKRGAGGIREVEFVAQAFQIIRGGRDRRFQTPPLKEVLELLGQEGLLPLEDTERLYRGYRFLRNVEHVLQGWQDKQTQLLPADELGRCRVAYLMGCSSWDQFLLQLDEFRQFIHQLFEDVVAEQHQGDGGDDAPEEHPLAEQVWQAIDGDELMPDELGTMGYDLPEKAAEMINTLRGSRSVQSMANDTRGRLDKLMPQLISICGQRDNATETLGRVLKLVEAVARRSAYLLLLKENPAALQSTVKLFSGSSWVADQLVRYPALLDELLDSRTLFSLPEKSTLEDELHQQLLRVPTDDLESQMEVLRYFQQSHSLRVAACELEEILPLMKVSDYLTWLAEAILSHVLQLAWNQLVERHGYPKTAEGETAGFLIVGYGKLGGIELGHGSDLDLVFLHDADAAASTDGVHPLDSATFFARLGQRIVHILTAKTSSGDLYEVDMRLRPSGSSGMLVSSLTAFEKYQLGEAWTWEHQALVRARPVAGPEKLVRAFAEIRQRVLVLPRQRDKLIADVLEMRGRMKKHLASGKADQDRVFHLKHDPGGIVDIEFMVQFAVLAWSHDIPDLTRWSDNIRILECLEESGVLSVEDADILISAYKNYRSAGHRLQLQQAELVVSAAEFAVQRQQVAALWHRLLGEE
ncbi:MAG: glutamate-ammonia-ligase adenylyltransferase [Porticoccus sp.]|jgi:glutamate-ammonia-ligase adenylyltransferase|uniref:bifunctional [glutamate--ammonia ligase]-adenylyl-L-tyrosine phosphorylase/[glutamate--ammonia-ligase] adenylyltransferase n=1 Tax=Porticoccus sp. TaxID=2024853 RepID=UPI0039E28330|tara:strand:+ start:37003 stop:39909 length:2907 start_codon:yes stop_codon:yes gene_type:complete